MLQLLFIFFLFSTTTCFPKSHETLPRIYIPTAPLAPNILVPLTQPQTHYLTKVLRLRPNDNVRVFDGKSGEWIASFHSSKRDAHVVCLKCIKQQRNEEGPELYLAPLHSSKRLKTLIEKCTELGVSKFVPVKTDYTQSPIKFPFEKLKLIGMEASEQCERMTIPQFDDLISLEDLLKTWKEDRVLLICRERFSTPILKVLEDSRKVAFLIGPEGGWSPKEEEFFEEYCADRRIQCVSLGRLVLRAETAAMMAVGAAMMVSHQLEDTTLSKQ